ncbi:hypothetical protein H0H93_006187 [Arthromyces matolae]|nr:hypothetical protein H0H93_006187 [Arthromyces matolae]
MTNTDLKEPGLYERLIKSKGADAQKLLDTFQCLLDSDEGDAAFRRRLLVAMQRLSHKSRLYPTVYSLDHENIQVEKHPVAAGGFADIHKGTWNGYAICVKKIRIYQDTSTTHTFKQISKEAIIWRQLIHPNVLEIYGVYVWEGGKCILSRWMENRDINKYLESNPTVSRPQLALDVASGLAYLHSKDIVHGDLKGANILVDATGRACLSDFGLSSVYDLDIAAWASYSQAASTGGSLRWQAPELLPFQDDDEDDDDVHNTKASDVYAWGCVCIEIFMGHHPFSNAKNNGKVTYLIQSGRPPAQRPDPFNSCWTEAGLSQQIWMFMERCWQKIPSDRPSTADIVKLWTSLGYAEASAKDSEASHRFRPELCRKEPLTVLTVETLDAILCGVDEYDVSTKATASIPRESPFEDAQMDSGSSGMMILPKNLLTRLSKSRRKMNLTTSDIFLQDPRPSDVVIAIMGATGAGKSTFINTLLGKQVAPVGVGHSISSHTAFVQAYTYNDPEFPKNRIVMVDTPGFDDTSLSDREILRRIGVWLAQSYDARMKMAGVIYLHDISVEWWQGSTARNSEVFERLCSQAAARNFVLVTTMWDRLVSKAVGEKREEELKMQYWKGMIETGSAVHRGSLEQMAAQDTVDFLLGATYPLQIQKELGEVNKTLQDTEDVRHLLGSEEAFEVFLKTRENYLAKKRGRKTIPPKKIVKSGRSPSKFFWRFHRDDRDYLD